MGDGPGEHKHPDVRPTPAQDRDQGQTAIDVGQSWIDDDDVRVSLLADAQGLADVTGLPDDLQSIAEGEEAGKARPHAVVGVDDDDAVWAERFVGELRGARFDHESMVADEALLA